MFDIHWDGHEQPGVVTVHHPVVSPLPIAPFSLPGQSQGEGDKSPEVSCELCNKEVHRERVDISYIMSLFC